MSGSNAETVRRAIDAYNACDADALCSKAHPEIDVRPPVAKLQGRAYSGHDGVRQWLRDVEESFDQARIEVDELSEIDSRVLMLGRFVIRGRGSQIELVESLGVVCEVSAGKISRWHGFWNHAQAIETAELEGC